MEAGKKTLTVTRWVWCDEAARALAATLRGVPCYTVEDYRREVSAGGATLLRVATAAGATVGYAVLRVERYAGGAEGVILAASGRLRGVRLYEELLPVLEGMFHGVRSFRIDNCRPGALQKLVRAGYVATHTVMRKPARRENTRESALEALALISVPLGGGDMRAMPGGRLHKGGSSNSTTAQTTSNTDRRLVVDSGSVGVSSDTSHVNVSVLDGGAIYSAQQLANNAVQSNYLQSRAALDSIRAAAALVGAKDAATGTTLNSVLNYGQSAFAGAVNLARFSNADALDFSRQTFDGALDAMRMGNSDALEFARAASDGVAEANRRTVGEALGYVDAASGRAFDAVRMGNADALAVARDAQSNAFDEVRLARNDAFGFARDESAGVAEANRLTVAGALDFAGQAAERESDTAWRTFTDALAFSQNVFDAGLGVIDTAGRQVEAQAGIVAAAYDNAQGEGTQKTYIAAAALAVVAIAAISRWGK